MPRKREDYFSGRTDMSLCFRELYARLMSGEWVRYAEVLKAIWPNYIELHPDIKGYRREWPEKSYSTDDRTRPLNNTLKKTWVLIVDMLRTKTGHHECIIEDGKQKGKAIRYDLRFGNDPLKELRDSEAIQSIKRYVQFCQDLDGLIPRVWTDYFLRNTKDLLDIKERRSTQCIKADVNPELRNLYLLPRLYEAIIHQEVLQFDYCNLKGQYYTNVVFHPQFLREFNGRWQLFGETASFESEFDAPFYNVAIDRIQTPPVVVATESYRKAPTNRYSTYFANIIGVTHQDLNDPQNRNNARVYTARLRALNYNVYHLIQTKKLHPSQVLVTDYGQYADGEYGEFELHVELNYEFVGKVLSFGPGVQIMGEPHLLRYFRDEVIKRMAEQYELVPKTQ